MTRSHTGTAPRARRAGGDRKPDLPGGQRTGLGRGLCAPVMRGGAGVSGVGCIDQPEHELKPGPPAAPYGDRPGASPAQGVAGNVRSVVSAAIFKDADCLNSPPQLDRLSEAKKIQDVSLGSRSLSRHMADGQCDLAARLAQPVGTRHARCARPSWSSSQCLPAGTTRWHAASDWAKRLWRPAAAQPQ